MSALGGKRTLAKTHPTTTNIASLMRTKKSVSRNDWSSSTLLTANPKTSAKNDRQHRPGLSATLSAGSGVADFFKRGRNAGGLTST